MIKRLFDIAIIVIFTPFFLPIILLISIFSMLIKESQYFSYKIELEKIIKYLNFINLELWK